MQLKEKNHPSGNVVWPIIFALLCLALAGRPLKASDENETIPGGTILPVRLNSTLSSSKSKPGQIITGRIMQDVPLPTGAVIRAGSKVLGHIVAVTPATGGESVRISLKFDKLISANRVIPVTTDIRAIASFMTVLEAQTPTSGPGEGDVYDWLPTVQVGGDAVYGLGGPVTSGDNPNEVVGRAVYGGVLSRVRAKEGEKCRGAINGDDHPQALWVFSSDSCGTYNLQHLSIMHAGRTDPTGLIVVASSTRKLKIPEGAGMLLRVVASNQSLNASR
ncbi:MAG: hypothetical protein WBE13_05360 [Candidatus Acidiferrum sp.]